MRKKSRYGDDVLAEHRKRPRTDRTAEVALESGLVVESAGEEFCGAVAAWDKATVTLEDRHGRRRVFELAPAGFLIDGRPVTLRPPAPAAPRTRRSTSGSVMVPDARAKVARESRIYVEGRHDAELVERIWGHDLRVEGIVVEYLSGVDDLPAIVEEFSPGPRRRLGVLVDHLVAGSKESRIASEIESPDVLVAGHPFVDIWAAVKPEAVGIAAWPEVPPGVPWKEGVLRALGWAEEPPEAWRRILASVRGYTDLEPELLGRVERLIDFVSEPHLDSPR